MAFSSFPSARPHARGTIALPQIRLLALPIPWPRAVDLVIVAAVAWAIFYTLAYVSIYSKPHPAVVMSRWIAGNVPPGATIAREHWEESLPNLGGYRVVELPMYEPDEDANKVRRLVDEIQRNDYIVFYSNRLYGTISRLPERYPVSTEYYRALFRGQLGFELVRVETGYPNLLGISLADDTFGRPGLPVPPLLAGHRPTPIVLQGGYADESFTVYDHPKVMLFRKTRRLGETEIRAIIGATGSVRVVRLPSGEQPTVRRETGLLLSEADARANQAGGTWSEIFQRESLANQAPLLVWLLVAELIGLAAFPLTWLACRALPDRGYLLAKALGLLLVAHLAWLAASLHLATWTGPTLLGALGLVAAISAGVAVRFRAEIVTFVRREWPMLALGEVIFLTGFLAFAAIRMLNPDLWHAWRGGEKPMDFAYLNAVIRTTYFPAYDPWFAGGYLNYYYFGQVVVAAMAKLTGVVPEVSYNLAIPLLFALTLGGAFSVGSNLVRIVRREAVVPAAVAGIGAGLLVSSAGNLDGLVQLADGLWKAGNLNIRSSIPGLSELANALAGANAVIFQGKALPVFDYWRSSRMMPPTISITEFPYFTFLFADLHAHLIGLPFTVLAIGLALATLAGGRGSGVGSQGSGVG
ncbi:MAG: DUF2298 domain-containing protein, partial [Chloroflexi bacterium]|nr:DUF2298 domain-containing protein [Chloroflexota bacterium]